MHDMDRWYTIYTKQKNEDTVTSRLRDAGISVLNPKLKLKKYKRARLVESIEPLFPCYIFACFDKDRMAHLISYTRGVRYIVGRDSPIVVHDEIMSSIRENMEEGDIIVIRPQRFLKGDAVRIHDGPFRDFQGVFEREMKGPERVLILLNTINYHLEIDAHLLTKE
jgi:transcriptional antiterminator RfaH